MIEDRINSDDDRKIYAISILESSISRTLSLTVALATLSYLPIAGIIEVPLGPLPLYVLAFATAAQVIALAGVEKAVRLPRSTLTVPAAAFFFILILSSIGLRLPLGWTAGSGSFGGNVAMAFMAYSGYIFLDSRRDRRKLLVLLSFTLAAVFIADLIRMAIAAIGVTAAGKPGPMVASAVEAGLYFSFAVPLMAAQVIERRSWMSRYSFLPALVGGLTYEITAAPPLAIVATIAGLATLFLVSRKVLAFAAVPVLAAIALAGAVLVSSYASPISRPGSSAAPHPKPEAPISKRAIDKANRLFDELLPDERSGLGAAPALLFLVLLVAFLIQSAPRISDMADYEKAFNLGVLAGFAGYAIFSTAYGSSATVSPAAWLMVGAAARLINPAEKPVFNLGLRKNSRC